MNYWEQREAELLRQENAWYNELSPFMKMIDNVWYFCIFFLTTCFLCFDLGFLIGIML